MDLVRVGKVKDVYDDGNTLLFKFSDRISVFDKIIPNDIPEKGKSLCRTSAYWFTEIKRELNIDSHFIENIDQKTMRVKKFRVEEKGGSKFWVNYLIPLEFIMRYYAAGSLIDRMKSGKLKPSDVGMKNIPSPGEKLDEPFFEMTTKFEKTDRPLSRMEAMELGGISCEELNEIQEIILKIDRLIERKASNGGLIHADGKKEFAIGAERNPIVVDTFGTADEDRFWEKKDYENGKLIEVSKEMVRQYYRSIGYHSKLYEAREKNETEPDIPPLPSDLIKKVSDLYVSVYERLTGQKW
ncbi:phosphoribosylaminoimidazolesuccinocarboxamide synthase [Caldiplasma sukawensis]